MKRRALLGLAGAALAAPALADGRRPTLGVALGSGGAKGLAHLSVLQALEELKLKPAAVTGTSSGALIGALYCGGRPPSELRRLIGARFALDKDRKAGGPWERYMPKQLLEVAELVETGLAEGGLIRAERFLEVMLSFIEARRFEDLAIPLTVVATDFWTGEEVRFSSGPLKPAIQASMALPGVFTPVERDGRVLVDGGLVNPVPFDLLQGRVDKVLAVDVMGRKTPDGTRAVPSAMEAVFHSFQIMEKAIVRQKRARRDADLYVEAPIIDVATLEFYEAERIYAQVDPLRAGVKRRLQAMLEMR